MEEKNKIYTHDMATIIVEAFEDELLKHDIRVPSPEDDEREKDDTGLYGTTYSDLVDYTEYMIIEIINRCKNGAEVVTGEFSGTI